MDKLTEKSITFVRECISKKNNYSKPYYCRQGEAMNVVTDMDHFPYSRFYRGMYNNPNPVVMDREAGWRTQDDECYKPRYDYEIPYPNHPFKSSC
jgi:hypothetical protein